MTPRSFFAIVIKILGLYLILSSVVALPELIATFFNSYLFGNDLASRVFVVVLAVITLVLYCLVLLFCLLKTDWIIDKLHLDKHFTEEKFELNISQSSILSIAIIVIGGMIFIDAIPAFCKSFYNYVSTMDAPFHLGQKSSPGWMIYHLAQIIMSYVLMTNSRLFVNLIEKNTQQ
jgi:Ca2+/H+ antiporter